MAFVDASSEIAVLPALGQALVAEGERLFSLNAEDNEPKLFYFEDYSGCTPADLLGFPVSPDTAEESLRALVSGEKDRSDALFLFLASLDISLSREIREEAASTVEALLESAELNQYMEQVLLSEPFCATKGAPLELSFTAFEKYAHLVSLTVDHQDAANAFWLAWNTLANESDSLSISLDVDSLRDLLLSQGLTAKFIRAIHNQDLFAFNREIVELTVKPHVRNRFATAAQLLTRLRNLLDKRKAFTKLQMSFGASAALQSDSPDPETGDVWSGHGRTLFNHEIYSQIIKQINSIKSLLLTGSRNLVNRAVRELLEFQKLHNEGPDYLAMTLCNLAKIAIDADEIDVAKDLSDQASALGVHDPVVDSTAAEVMKNLGYFADAKALYEAAIERFGNQRYLINGLADVLKEDGDYESALAIYARAEREFPDDPVASNGIATVFFAMGHSERALAKARSNVTMFGDNVSRIICGNILRHMGRNHESLTLMKETVEKFPKELLAWSGYIRSLGLVGRHQDAIRKCDEFIAAAPDQPMPKLLKGDLLRKFGRLPESLNIFEKALVQFPSHRGLQLGKASVLLLLGKANEAAKLADISNPRSELDWRMFHIFACSYIRSGNCGEALSLLERGLDSVPWRKLRSLFSDTIGYVKLKMGDARAAILDFREGLKTADRTKRNGLYLLLGRAFREIGNYGESARYIAGVESTDAPVKELKAAVSSGIFLVSSSHPGDPKIEQNELQMLLAAA